MRSGSKALLGGLAALALAGCGGKLKYWQAEGAPKQLVIGAEDKIFIMPADIHVSTGDKLALSLALNGGFVSAYGNSGIPGQPLKPLMEAAGVYNLSYLLAEGMVHGAFDHGDANTFDHAYQELPQLLGNFFGWLREQGSAVRYVAVVHIDQRPLPFPWSLIDRKGRSAQLEIMGGVYDVERQQTVVVIDYFQRMPAKTMTANMAIIGGNVAKFLACPSQGKECKDAAPTAAAPAGSAMLMGEPENVRIWKNPAYR